MQVHEELVPTYATADNIICEYCLGPMGGCSIFRECRWLPYFAIAGGKLSDQINNYGCLTTKRGGENGTTCPCEVKPILQT